MLKLPIPSCVAGFMPEALTSGTAIVVYIFIILSVIAALLQSFLMNS